MTDKIPERRSTSITTLAASKKGEPICQQRFPCHLHDMLRDATTNGLLTTSCRGFLAELRSKCPTKTCLKSSLCRFTPRCRTASYFFDNSICTSPGDCNQVRGEIYYLFYHFWKLTNSSLFPSYETAGSYSHNYLARDRRQECRWLKRKRKENFGGPPSELATQNNPLCNTALC
jgi:hypothetical protein